MIGPANIDGKTLTFTLQFKPDHTNEMRTRLEEALRRQLTKAGWQGDVQVNVKTQAAPPKKRPQNKAPIKGMANNGMQPHGGPIKLAPIKGVTHIIAVASGKGGVGKSTVASNLAVGLRRRGHEVGLVDADIYGPSLPTMMNIQGRPLATPENKIIPLEAYGVKCMSIGFLVDPEEPVIWRGPMVMGVVKQFLQEVAWGELDFLLVDLPPGTGDAQLTLIQAVPISGSIIVTTPQDVAVMDAVRGIEMFRKLQVPVLGIVENMSWLSLPDGTRMEPFGSGGGKRTAEKYDVPLIAQIPLCPAIRAGGDAGRPALANEDTPESQSFESVLDAVENTFPIPPNDAP